jgi:hypothetical protein
MVAIQNEDVNKEKHALLTPILGTQHTQTSYEIRWKAKCHNPIQTYKRLARRRNVKV